MRQRVVALQRRCDGRYHQAQADPDEAVQHEEVPQLARGIAIEAKQHGSQRRADPHGGAVADFGGEDEEADGGHREVRDPVRYHYHGCCCCQTLARLLQRGWVHETEALVLQEQRQQQYQSGDALKDTPVSQQHQQEDLILDGWWADMRRHRGRCRHGLRYLLTFLRVDLLLRLHDYVLLVLEESGHEDQAQDRHASGDVPRPM
mmetsp:Transcript_98357/g.234141  ORF Transcript_98357/g.234141 Transcript_98357/m.234141 type:complete len:204 (+) Transcript_98357:712-1323(+)